jgi:hypothetical protein
MTLHRSNPTLLLAALGLTLAAGTAPARTARRRTPPRLPKATAIPLSIGDTVTIGGQQFTVSATLVPSGTTPTPLPTPTPIPVPKPTVTGIRNRATGLLVTTAKPGDSLQIEGTQLGATMGRLQLAGRIVPSPSAWTATAIPFIAPDPGATAVTGTWDIYQPSGSAWALVASSGLFTLLPAGSPAPAPTPAPTPTPTPAPTPLPTRTPLLVTGFRDAMGQLAQGFTPGQMIFIQGQGFGTTAGTVSIGSSPAPVLQWTETEIQVRCPAGPPGPVMLTVTSADGKQWDRLKAWAILAPGGVKR